MLSSLEENVLMKRKTDLMFKSVTFENITSELFSIRHISDEKNSTICAELLLQLRYGSFAVWVG